MSKIWLSSDLHLFHDQDFIWKNRGFNSVKEMNEAIIENFNSKISDEDTVYLLGDMMLNCAAEAGLKLLSQIKGKKYLAYGNHDTDSRIQAYKESGVFEDIQMGYRLRNNYATYILTHYPTVVSNYGETDVVNLHGHTHSTEKFENELYYLYHVGIDAHNNFPVELTEINKDIEFLKNK